jgi:glycosyltransferase involved in cell wall biosynthesis
MVFYEAQACGAPLISTKGFGSEYAIKDGYNGFLTEQNDVEGTAAAIRKIMGNPGLHAEMLQHSLGEAEKHTWDNIAILLMKMYNDGLRHESSIS